MAGRLFSSPPWLPLHLPRVSTAILGSSLLRNLPRGLWGKIRLTALYLLPHPLIPLLSSLVSRSPCSQTMFLLSFDRIWISRYKLFPLPLSLFLFLLPSFCVATRDRSKEANSIFFGKNSAHSRTFGFTCLIAIWWPKGVTGRSVLSSCTVLRYLVCKTRNEIFDSRWGFQKFHVCCAQVLCSLNVYCRKWLSNGFINSDVITNTTNQGSVLSGR